MTAILMFVRVFFSFSFKPLSDYVRLTIKKKFAEVKKKQQIIKKLADVFYSLAIGDHSKASEYFKKT